MTKDQYARMIQLETPYAKDNASLTTDEKRELLGLFAIHEACLDEQNEAGRLAQQGIVASFAPGAHCSNIDAHAFSGAVGAGDY